jgi:hypothetical protein
MNNTDKIDYRTFEATLDRSNKLEEDLTKHPENCRVLNG